MATRKEIFQEGSRAMSPILLGVIPFGLIAGVAAVSAGLSIPAASGMSVFVFAGAAQLASIDLIGRNAPLWVVVVTALVINLRFCMYSATLAPHFRHLSYGKKMTEAYLLTDQAFAVSIIRYNQPIEDEHKFWFYTGAGLTLWIVWQISTVIGAVLGAGIPPEFSLDFAVPLTFLALMFPVITDRPSLAAAAVAAVVGIVTVGLPHNLGLIVSALCGILVGMVLEGGRS